MSDRPPLADTALDPEGPYLAIVGMAGRFPGADDPEALWQHRGRSAIHRFTAEELTAAGVDPALVAHPDYVPARGILADVAGFDAAFFGLGARAAETMDPQQRLFLEVAWEACEDAGCDPARTAGAIGVYAGCGISTYLLENLLPHRELIAELDVFELATRNAQDYLATRVAFALDLRGPALTVQTACSTSLVAVHLAAQALLAGDCDLALAGGVSVPVPQQAGYLHRAGGIHSPDGCCRPFDAAAAGTVQGTGAGVVVMKRLADALADGDRVRAVVRGSAINNDGADKAGLTAPSIAGQAAVVAEALSVAGVDAGNVGYLETHGTATPLGDPIEIAALTEAFRRTTDRRGSCALGALKATVGHLDAAAGVAGLIKAVLALERRTIPPLHGFERPNPRLDLESSPFRVERDDAPWESDGPRRAGVSSFGFGGTNAHVVLEEAPPSPPPASAPRPWQVLPLAARTPTALAALAGRLAAHLETPGDAPPPSLADVAWTLQVGRRAFSHRRAVVARDAAEAAALLRAVAATPAATAPTSNDAGDDAGDEGGDDAGVVFLFPGQGVQAVGMGRGLYAAEPVYRATVDELADAFAPILGCDLRRVLDPAAGEEAAARTALAGTAVAQAAVFTLELALADLWRSWGVRPRAVLGHSLGEVAAAVVAGVLGRADAAALVAERGRWMATLPAGEMVAVALAEAELRPLLEDGLALAAVNGPRATVASGPPAAVARLVAELDRRRVAWRRLATDRAYHSAAVEPILGPIAAFAAGLARRPATVPWLSAAEGDWMGAAAATSSRYWADHLRRPVRFAAALERLLSTTAEATPPVFLEVGPGRTLSALVRRGSRGTALALPSADPSDADPVALLQRSLGQLWEAGVGVDWAGLQGPGRRRVGLPTYPFERRRYWIDPPPRTATLATPDHQPTTAEPTGDSRLLWRETPRSRQPTTVAARRWLLLPGDADERHARLAADLAAALRRDGAAVDVEPLAAAAGRHRHAELLERLGTTDSAPLQVVDLRAAGTAGFDGAVALLQALGARRLAPPPRVLVVAPGATSVAGEAAAPWRAALLALGTADGVACRVLDVADPRPETLVAEALADPPATDDATAVAHRGGRRWQRAWQPVAGETSPAVLAADGAYLVTGDLGGPGGAAVAVVIEALAAAGARRVGLVGDDAGDVAPGDGLEAIDATWRRVRRRLPVTSLTAVPALGRDLDRLVAAGARAVLAALGVAADGGDAAAAARQAGVVAEHRRLFGELYAIAGEAEAGDDPGEIERRLLAAEPELAPLLGLVAHALARYPQVLRGTLPAVAVLHGGAAEGLLHDAREAIARRWTGARALATAGEVVAALAATASSARAPLRVLEVGGGRGGLTLPVLAALGDRAVDYHFTDLGPSFVAEARATAERLGLRGLRFSTFDLAAEAGPQGLAAESYDVVLGLDVVHATADVPRTLARLAGLLAPGGVTLLVESSQTPHWANLLWGLEKGWWDFADGLRRRSPLLGPEAWEEALRGAGYGAVAAFPRDNAERRASDAALVVGQRPPVAGRPDRLAALATVARTRREDAAARRRALAEHGVELAVADPALPIGAAIAELETRLGAFRGVVHTAWPAPGLPLAVASPAAVRREVATTLDDTAALVHHFAGRTLEPAVAIVGEPAAGDLPSLAAAVAAAGVESLVAGDGWRVLRWPLDGRGRPRELSAQRLRAALAGDEPLRRLSPRMATTEPGASPSARPQPEITAPAAATASSPGSHPRPELAVPYREPAGELEARIAALWARFLGLDRVGRDDELLALGGDSLVVTQIATALQAQLEPGLGRELPIRPLLAARTVAEMARAAEEATADAGESDDGAIAPAAEPVVDEAPLTSGQRRLWFLSRLDPESPAYNVPVVLELRGELDRAALARALEALVHRHAVLRARFVETADGPRQRIAPPAPLPLPVVDLRTAADPEATAAAEVAAEVRRTFDLARGPLLRARLWRTADNRHLLAVTLHHAVTDGWSLALLMDEVAALYGAFTAGGPSPLPALPIQVPDVARREAVALATPATRQAIARWCERLAGLPTLELPTDRPRPPTPSWRGAQLPVTLPAELVARLAAVARERGATLFMVLLAGFHALLARWSGQHDFAVGTVLANRLRPELEPLIGYFANTLPLRADLGGDPTVNELLERTRRVAEAAYADQEVPFERLVEAMGVTRDDSRTPFFQVLFVLQNTPRTSLALPGLELRRLPYDAGTARFDLTLSLGQGADGEVSGVVEYATDLFDAATVERLAGHYRTLLEGLAADPERRLSTLPLLGADEERALAAWNDTAADLAAELGLPAAATQSVADLFAHQATLTPDAVAIIGPPADAGADAEIAERDLTLTYGELARRVDALARRLRAAGVGPEVRVAIGLERSLEMVVALLAVLRAGGAYVPLDPDDPPQRLAWIAEDAGAALVLTSPAVRPRLPETLPPVLELVPGADGLLAADGPDDAAAPPPPAIDPSGLAYVIYTSGSTGRPKGAMNEHAGVVNRLLWMQRHFRLGADDRVLQKTPLGFDVSVWELFWPLISGARLVLARPGGHRDAAYLARRIREQAITTVHFVPSLLAPFLAAPGAAECASLRRVVASGEALPRELCRRFFELFPERPGAAACELHNLYGPTEAAVDVSAWACRRDADGPVPIGGPIANLRLHVLDGHLAPVPVGVAGELTLGGVGVGRGYLGRPGLTAERFVPDPFAERPGARMYRTGDLARRRADGAIEFLGRLDGQVKIRGVRLELGEVEAALLRHPAVRQAAVTVHHADGEPRLVAYLVVAAPGDDATATDDAALRRHLAAELPAAMVPSQLVRLDALPLTASGKLDRRALPQPPAPSPGGAAALPPASAEETLVAAVFAEVLGHEAIGPDDDFFAAGGHSLLAAQAIARFRQLADVELPLRELFASPTARALGRRLADARRSGTASAAPPLAPLPAGTAPPLSPAQRRLWLLDRMAPGGVAYNIPLALDLDGPLDIAALETAIVALARRHQVLATAYPAGADGEPRARPADREVTLGIEDAVDDAVLARATEREAHRPFDLAHDPPLRARLLRRGGDRHRLLLTLHHIAADGWSVGIVVRELAALYEAARDGRPSPLAPLPLQFGDWASSQQADLARRDLAAEVEPLRRALAGWRPLALAGAAREQLDGPPSDRGGQVAGHLPAATVAGLRALARDAGGTLFATLLATWTLFLHQLSGRRLVVVGTPVADRPRPELEGLVGLFLDTVPIAVEVDPAAGFRRHLATVHAATLAALGRPPLPFDRLVEALGVARDGGHTPLVETMLTLHNTPFPALELPGIAARRVPTATATSKLDLTLNAVESAGEVELLLEYRSDLFGAPAAGAHLDLVIAIAAAAVATPDEGIAALVAATAAEVERARLERLQARRLESRPLLRQPRPVAT